MIDDHEWQFVDTNILVYAHDAGAGQKHAAAQTLVETLWQSRRGCLSVQVLQEFYVTVTRKVTAPLSAREAAAIIDDLQLWRVHVPTAVDVLAAIGVQTRHQLSFWDAMIIHSANSLACPIIWTEDLNSGQVFNQSTIKSPFSE